MLMDYKFVVIRHVHNVLIRFDTERGRTGPGNHNKKKFQAFFACCVFCSANLCLLLPCLPGLFSTTDESYEGKLKIYDVRTVYFERLLHLSSPKCS